MFINRDTLNIKGKGKVKETLKNGTFVRIKEVGRKLRRFTGSYLKVVGRQHTHLILECLHSSQRCIVPRANLIKLADEMVKGYRPRIPTIQNYIGYVIKLVDCSLPLLVTRTDEGNLRLVNGDKRNANIHVGNLIPKNWHNKKFEVLATSEDVLSNSNPKYGYIRDVWNMLHN